MLASRYTSLMALSKRMQRPLLRLRCYQRPACVPLSLLFVRVILLSSFRLRELSRPHPLVRLLFVRVCLAMNASTVSSPFSFTNWNGGKVVLIAAFRASSLAVAFSILRRRAYNIAPLRPGTTFIIFSVPELKSSASSACFSKLTPPALSKGRSMRGNMGRKKRRQWRISDPNWLRTNQNYSRINPGQSDK